MFSVKAYRVKSLTVLGKLLILLSINPAYADINNPRFFEYRGGPVLERVLNLSFGWFKTLDQNEKSAYHSSITHAVMAAENGERVVWYRGNASGMTVPAMTYPTGGGYCRRLHIQVTKYNVTKTSGITACFDGANNRWTWKNG